MFMDFIILPVFIILGFIIGSFLNVVVLRYNTQKSLGGRSACMSCQNKLQWYELVPVFSFFALRGRCRTCQTKISMQYPLVEIVSGAIFGFIFWKFKEVFYVDPLIFAFTYSYYVTIFSILLVITVYDIKHKIIPDVLAFIFGVFAFVGMFFFDSSSFNPLNSFYPHIPSLADFLAGFVISLPFAFFWWVSRGEWMGLGDAKLALGLGFLLGFAGTLSATVIAFWSGALIGVLLVLIRKVSGMKSEIPFAPFLVFGAFLVFVFGLNLFAIL